MSQTVLVTGATGFIAQHVVNELLKNGYTVIGTARSETKSQPLIKLFKEKYPNGNLSFVIVEDISTDSAFDDVLINNKSITNVIHTASPFSYGIDKLLEDAYLNPAVNGTLNILNAIYKYAPQVENVIITSSFAALKQYGNEYTTHIHTNESWNPINWENDVKTENDGYSASKTYAEKAARNFMIQQDPKPNFKLTTVNPPYVFGPQCFDDYVSNKLNTSNEVLNNITKIDPSNNEPQVVFGALAIDVRDVAKFHVLPLSNENLQSERIFLTSGPVTAQNVLNIMNESCDTLKGKIAIGDPSKTNEIIEKNCPKYDLSNLKSIIGDYEFINLEKSTVDVFDQYYKVNSV